MAAYVIAGNPFSKAAKKDGSAPTTKMLRLHLAAIAALPTSKLLLAVLAVLPSAPQHMMEHPGYAVLDDEVRQLPCRFELIRVDNNTLGSYGMYLHAFAMHRRDFEFYIFSEVDYVPVHAYFAAVVVEMYNVTFSQRTPAVLAALLQGRPVEDKLGMHPEGAHVMSALSLEHLFEHVYGVHRPAWNTSMADRMVNLVFSKGSRGRFTRSRFDHIQEGFWLLMAEAGIVMKDWASAFRTPYWNHAEVVDWSGFTEHGTLPMDRVLFAPAQWLYVLRVRRCCYGTWSSCRHKKLTCVVRNWRANATDCCRVDQVNREQIRRHLPYSASFSQRPSLEVPTIHTGRNGSRKKPGFLTLLQVPPIGFANEEPQPLRAMRPSQRGSRETPGSFTQLALQAPPAGVAKKVPRAHLQCTKGFTDPDYCNNRCPTDKSSRLNARPLPSAASGQGAERSTCPTTLDTADWPGHWEVAETGAVSWAVHGCRLHRPTVTDYRRRLRGQRMVLVGDCMMRYQYLSLVHYLQTGDWGPRVVDPQLLERENDTALPRSITSGFSLARSPGSGKTDYARFYQLSTRMLGGNEHCDCGMGNRRKGIFGRHENRYYRNAALNLSVTFFFLKGHAAVHGTDPLAGRSSSTNRRWRYRSVAKFLLAKVRPLLPTVLMINIGIWWFREDYSRRAFNATWWQGVLDASDASVQHTGSQIILRTTTVPAIWRSKDNDGVNQELLRTNAVDREVLSLIRKRRNASSSAAPRRYGVLDTYAMTASFPRDHCKVRDASGELVKFYSDDMHAQPYVYQEINTVLYNMLART